MTAKPPDTMRAVALDSFGGLETLELRTLPLPRPDAHEVLVRIEYAGVGEWDQFEREGGYAEMLGTEPRFPYVLGSEGAGVVAAIGADVTGVREGERVYAVGFLNPRGGFYAEYASADAGLVRPVPSGLSTVQAAVMGGVGLTALRGLEDTLAVKAGEVVMIFGASGGVGHIAVQLAKRMGSRVFAVASGADGVALARRLGADAAVDGRRDDVAAAVRAFAPDGVDAALLTAGGTVAERALTAMRADGRVAWPRGIHPEPRCDVAARAAYFGDPDADILGRMDRWMKQGSFDVHVADTFPLDDVVLAHRALDRHYLGKIALRVS
jgi:NADPH:quinone reductase